MKPIVLAVNDMAWLVTAILCVFFDHPAITAVVLITTAIYAVDLVFKFHGMGWKPIAFVRRYWLDILLLIPFIKIFRGLRIFKVGKMLTMADTACDFTEMVCRAYRFVKSRVAGNHGNHVNSNSCGNI